MENVVNITSYLKNVILQIGGNPERETLNVIKTKYNKNYYKDIDGGCWRLYKFIEDATTYDLVENVQDFLRKCSCFW